LTRSASRTDVTEDNTDYPTTNPQKRSLAVPGVFNGDFESGTLRLKDRFPLFANDVPGWSFHGGYVEGDAGHVLEVTEFPPGNHALQLGTIHFGIWNNTATHNRLFVPFGAGGLEFDLQVLNPSSTNELVVSLDTSGGKHVSLGTVSLSSENDDFDRHILEFTPDVLTAIADDRVASLIFEMTAPGFDIDDSLILLDNIGFTVVDLDVDANNDGVIDSADEAVENQSPGLVVVVNHDDKDNDGIPDFADGFDLDGISGNADDNPPTAEQGNHFAPVVITLVGGIDLSKARLKIDYLASDPAGVSRGAGASIVDYTPAPGHFRLWNIPGFEPRGMNSFADPTDPGNYVPATIDGTFYGPIELAMLGFSADTRSVTLYLEAVRPSRELGDQTIRIEVDPDGDGPIGFVGRDDVRLTIPSDMAVPYYNQGDTNWCDVTSLSMLIGYYGYERKPWQIAADLDRAPTDKIDIVKEQYTLMHYLEDRYDGGSSDAWVIEKFYSNDNFVDRLQKVLIAGHPVWVNSLDQRHVFVATGLDGISESDHVFFHDPDPTGGLRHRRTWSAFREFVDSRFESPFGDVYIVYAKTPLLSAIRGHASIQVMPGGLEFSNAVDGVARGLKLVWGGSEPQAGYRYEPTVAGWYPEDADGMYDNYGYHATQLDTLTIRPSYSNYSLLRDKFHLRTYVEVRNTATGSIEIAGPSATDPVSALTWELNPSNAAIAFSLADFPVGVYELSVQLQGSLDRSGPYDVLDECMFYFGVGAPFIDLDTDSNNDGVIDRDNGPSGTDDPIEENAPGKFVGVN
jgi:hypothetical protein